VREAIGRMEADDPRRPPYDATEQADAAGEAADGRRWHENGADWLALKLQFGRGVSVAELSRNSGVPQTTIRRHRDDGRWSRRLGPQAARAMARRVWLGGLARYPHDAASIAAVMQWSEWRVSAAVARPPSFAARKAAAGFTGRPEAMAEPQEEVPFIPYDPRFDPHCEDRILMRNKLDRLIADMERDLALEAEARAAGVGAAEAMTPEVGAADAVTPEDGEAPASEPGEQPEAS
jgi:hypothetical protein